MSLNRTIIEYSDIEEALLLVLLEHYKIPFVEANAYQITFDRKKGTITIDYFAKAQDTKSEEVGENEYTW